MSEYLIAKTPGLPPKEAAWEDPFWESAVTAEVTHFRKESSEHHPPTSVKVLWGEKRLFVLFRVEDYYVRAVTTEFGGPVWEDSCAEFFVEPVPGKGYFNIEMNCIGAFLIYHIVDCRRTDSGFEDFTKVTPRDAALLEVATSFPKGVPLDPEITEPVTWNIQYSVPYSLFSTYLGQEAAPKSGDTWRGNFYKCGDKTSHPHWGSWNKVGGDLNFHKPEHFGDLRFG